METPVFNVLFLCTHNSARSIIAEAIMNRLGEGRFRGYSAGSEPRGTVHPFALDMLTRQNYDVAALYSKPWEEFTRPDSPEMDFVFTVCDHAAKEICPVWPGQPMTAHWGIPDPSMTEGTQAEKRLAFADTHRMLYQRIGIFVNLPFTSLSKLALQEQVSAIGRMIDKAAPAAG